MTPTKPTVFVVDDDDGFCQLTRSLCGTVGLEVECFRSIDEFRNRTRTAQPGCLILDMRLPGASGLQLLESAPALRFPVIVVTAFEESAAVVRAFRAGCFDFIRKQTMSPQRYLERIQAALEHSEKNASQTYMQSIVMERLKLLTNAERRVFDLLIEGLRRKEIAAQLGVAPKTVESHRANLFRKLKVRTLGQLFRASAAAGILEPDVGLVG